MWLGTAAQGEEGYPFQVEETHVRITDLTTPDDCAVVQAECSQQSTVSKGETAKPRHVVDPGQTYSIQRSEGILRLSDS